MIDPYYIHYYSSLGGRSVLVVMVMLAGWQKEVSFTEFYKFCNLASKIVMHIFNV